MVAFDGLGVLREDCDEPARTKIFDARIVPGPLVDWVVKYRWREGVALCTRRLIAWRSGRTTSCALLNDLELREVRFDWIDTKCRDGNRCRLDFPQ